jgi:ABC-2 type transport system permease protein
LPAQRDIALRRVIPLSAYLNNNLILQLIKILPMYYLANGVYNAFQQQGSFGGNVLDIGVTLAGVLVFFLLSAWVLHRQSAESSA